MLNLIFSQMEEIRNEMLMKILSHDARERRMCYNSQEILIFI